MKRISISEFDFFMGISIFCMLLTILWFVLAEREVSKGRVKCENTCLGLEYPEHYYNKNNCYCKNAINAKLIYTDKK